MGKSICGSASCGKDCVGTTSRWDSLNKRPINATKTLEPRASSGRPTVACRTHHTRRTEACTPHTGRRTCGADAAEHSSTGTASDSFHTIASQAWCVLNSESIPTDGGTRGDAACGSLRRASREVQNAPTRDPNAIKRLTQRDRREINGPASGVRAARVGWLAASVTWRACES